MSLGIFSALIACFISCNPAAATLQEPNIDNRLIASKTVNRHIKQVPPPLAISQQQSLPLPDVGQRLSQMPGEMLEPNPIELDVRELGITNDIELLEPDPSYPNNQLFIDSLDASEEEEPTNTEAETSEPQTTEPQTEAEPDTIFDEELGNLRLRPQSTGDPELGILRIQEIEEPTREVPPTPTYTGFITGRTSFLGGTNLFRAPIPLDDRVFQAGAGFYIFPRLSKSTSLFAGGEGNLVRYSNFSNISYNELQFQAGLRQRLTERMSAQISWRNQQLYTPGGETFFSTDYAELLLSRRDILNSKMWLDSYYQMRLSFSSPNSFSRFSQAMIASLNYGFTPKFRSSLIYQLFLDDYTQVERYDTYHQILGQISYDLSASSRISLFGGAKFGRSSAANVNFEDLIYGISFNTSLPVF